MVTKLQRNFMCMNFYYICVLLINRMRTNIDIDEKLIGRAMKALNVKTKKEAVETALRIVTEREARENIRKLRGKVEMFADDEGNKTRITSQ